MSLRIEGWHAVERRLATSFSILSFGTGLSLSVLAVYIVRQLHASTVAYGATMSIAALCGMVSGPAAGRIADRIGARRMYATLVWTMAAATALLAVATEWAAFVLVCLLVTCGRGGGAVLGALVGREVSPDRRVHYRAVVKTLTNLMMFLGLGLGAIVLSVNAHPLFQLCFVVEAATLVAAGGLVASSPSRTEQQADPSDGSSASAGARTRGGGVHRDSRFLLLSAINACMLLYSSLLTVALPLWIAAQARSLLWLVSVVTAVNLAAVLVLQIPVSRGIVDPRSAVRAGTGGGVLLGAGVLMFPLAGVVDGHSLRAVVLLALALLVGIGEVLYSAASWELLYALAPTESIGEYQGVYNLGLDASMLVAPALLAWLAGAAHTLEWLAVAGVFVIAAASLKPVVAGSHLRS